MEEVGLVLIGQLATGERLPTAAAEVEGATSSSKLITWTFSPMMGRLLL